MQNLNWNNIRSINNSQKEGFEELVCQLAKNDEFQNSKSFVRKGSPDAGVECFWILNDGKEVCYQAKFFTSPLTSTQWGEVDESVKTALEKHPNIIKYIVSIPQDRADARVKGRKSFLDKWNDAVVKWEKWAKEKDKEVEFIYEGSSELYNKLSKPQNIGKTLFWFNQDEYSNDWFFKQNNNKIEDLGVRYSPEINVDLDLKYVFDGLYLNNKFRKNVEENIDLGNNFFCDFINLTKNITEFNEFLLDIYSKFKDKIFELIHKESDNKFYNIKACYDNTRKYISGFYDKKKYFESIQGEETKQKLQKEFKKLLNSFVNVSNVLHHMDAELADSPYLLIEGEAGIGKSHLIADIIKRSYSDNQLSILLLGQHFYAGNIWTQIKDLLDIKSTKEEFLGALNSKAESINSRIIIYIDAINEGEGKDIWHDQLNGLLDDIKGFPNIGLVITIRSTYKDIILPDNFMKKVIHFKHRGFDNLYNAAKVFFEHYNIQEPPIPILNTEFYNPLFLKLFCKGLFDNNLTIIPQDYDNLNAIFNYLINAVNKSLSKKFDYDYKDFNLINEAIELVVSEMVKEPSFQITRKDANILFKENFKNDVTNSRNILRELINENILNENAIYNPITGKYDKEIVYFSYERLGDYLIAKTLINEDLDIIEKEKVINSNCKIYEYLKDKNTIIRNQSLVEAFSIIIPEKTNFELYELLENNEIYEIGEAFLDSLIWRSNSTINEKINNYIEKYILTINGLNNKFIDILVQLSLREEHFLNAYYLDSLLTDLEINERDYFWTIVINESEIARLFVDWVIDNRNIDNFSEESKKLLSIVLTWFLTSSNRILRDKSTKALVKIFQNNLPLLERLIIFFEKTNDLYVFERLYAVGYGATLRTRDEKQIKQFGTFVFEFIFKDKNPPEHHLLRDYARGIIEYAHYKGLLRFDISDSQPPYRSIMPTEIPSENELEVFNKKDGKVQSNLYELVMGYSDFARYTLGTNHHSKISNITISTYNVYYEIYNSSNKNKEELDNLIDFNKKYKSEFTKQEWKNQFRELHDNLENLLKELFKLSEDKAKTLHSYISNISEDYYSRKRFDISILQRLIINDIFKNIGWKEVFFEDHDFKDLRESYFNKETYSKKESIGKKYILISYYKWLAVILDNYLSEFDYTSHLDDKFKKYTGGSWSTNRRDIDPTILDQFYFDTDSYKNNEITYWYPKNEINWNHQNNKKWVLDKNDLVNPKKIIDIKDEDGNEWVNLYSFPSWYQDEDSIDSKKQVWYHIKSYIINKDDKDEIIQSLKNKNFFNHSIPQEMDIYEVYSREYYWSKAYEDCTYENHPENSDKRLHIEVNSEKIIGYQTSMNYIWYDTRDFSLEKTINIKRPTKYLYDLLELNFKDNEYEFYCPEDKLVLFNPAIKFQKGNDCLLVNKNYLIKKLASQNLDIIWLVLGAKEVIENMRITNEGDINTIYYLNNESKIEGELNLEPYKET
ncbi:AVAST type 2 anti-phage system protein Avs2 [Empedobacter brevis]